MDQEKTPEDKMKAIARRDEATLALRKELEERLQPFSDGVPFNLLRVTDCMYNAGGNEFIARIIIGKGLICAKAHLKHGEFIEWVENELWFSPRTARRYMLLVTRIPKDKLLFFSRVGLKKTYALLEEASEEDLEQLTEGEGMKGLSADRIDLMTASQLRIAFKRLKEQNRRKQDQIDKGLEQVEKLRRQLDDKVEVEKPYREMLKKVFNGQMDVEKNIISMLQLFNAEGAEPKIKRAVWSLFNEISARFAYEADLIGVEAGEAVPDLELTYSEERLQNNVKDLEEVYVDGGLDYLSNPGSEEAARAKAKADMKIEDAEILDEGKFPLHAELRESVNTETGEILS